jgi:hypothetical protein
MIDRTRALRAGLSCVIVFCCAAASALAASFTAPNGTATMTVTYRVTGGGEDLPASHERHVTWSVDDTYEVKATLTAAKPSGFAGLHRADATEKKREADRQQAATAAAADMGDMMAQAQKIMAQCGDDEACVQRETIRLSQTIDPNSAKLKSAKQNIAKASVAPGERYQLFSAKEQSGTYKVAEKSRVALFDAACSLKNEARCLVETNVAGSGAQTDGAGKTNFLTGATAEYDAEGGSLVLMLAAPGVATAASVQSGAKTGSGDVRRVPLKGMHVDPITVTCGDCRTASGKLVKNVEDELTGRPAKLEIAWTFVRP